VSRGTARLGLADREAVLDHAAELILAAWQSFDQARPGQPAVDPAVRDLLLGPLPEHPSDPLESLDDVARVLDTSLAQSRPRFFAYVGSSGLEIGVLGDALMASYDVNVALAAGGADLLERQVLAWVSELVGFGSGHGILTSGGMIANLSALAAARERALPGARVEGLGARRATLLCSSEAHGSVQRAAEILGIGSAKVHAIPVDDRGCMDVAACAATLDADRAAASVPVAVVATAGTTLTGAVDDIAALADLCARHGVWLHVDGAYGLPAASTATAGPRFDGLARADSATVDAHKWLFVPKACSVLLVRDPAGLRSAFAHDGAYLQPNPDGGAHPVDSTLEYSRPLRALKLWLALRVHGATAVRGAIEANLAQARLLASIVGENPALELLTEPQLSTVCFRHLLEDGDDPATDDHNERLARAIQAGGEIYLASAAIAGRTWLRACFVNHRTTDDDVRAIAPVVARTAASLG